LPVLKQANVVDAGGMGLLLIYEGALHYLKTGVILESEVPQEAGQKGKTAAAADFSALRTEDIHFQYCTEFIVTRKPKGKEPGLLRSYLEGIGDCVVVVDDEEIIKVHVHTNNPAKPWRRPLPSVLSPT
jgi:dihydroxyacetone kinase-like predicted kinase